MKRFVLIFFITILTINLVNSYQYDNILQDKNLQSEFIQSIQSFQFKSEQEYYQLKGNLYPEYWENVSELNNENFVMDSSGNFIIDAFDYMNRLTLYKTLLDVTSLESICNSANNNNKNILWGLPLQHGWQYTSGRLFSDNTTIIDSKSWWGDMNYYLSIIPYLGAVKLSIVPSIILSNNPNPKLFCDSYDECSNLIDKWSLFFTNYLSYQQNQCNNNENDNVNFFNSITNIFNTPIDNKIDFNLTIAYEDVLLLLWDAHTTSISTALPLFQSKLIYLSKKESEFGLAWSNLVGYIAKTAFPCDIATTNILQNLLPPRLLTDDDQVPFINDFTRLQNRAIALIDGLFIADTLSNEKVYNSWIILMCTEQNRALGREMIMVGLYRLIVLIEDMKVLFESECIPIL